MTDTNWRHSVSIVKIGGFYATLRCSVVRSAYAGMNSESTEMIYPMSFANRFRRLGLQTSFYHFFTTATVTDLTGAQGETK